jgi:ketosteroid isomerase-like protein
MKPMRWLSRTLLCAGVLVAAATASAQTPVPDSLAAPVDTVVTAPADTTRITHHADALSQVVALEERRRKAMVAADTHTLETIIAEDATYVHSTGIMQKRDELLRLLANQTIRYISFDVEKTSYRVYGSTVVGTGVQSIKVMSGGKSLVIHSRYTVVYADKDGVEKLIAYQSTPLPEMTSAKK